jgi:hypothetical protein
MKIDLLKLSVLSMKSANGGMSKENGRVEKDDAELRGRRVLSRGGGRALLVWRVRMICWGEG